MALAGAANTFTPWDGALFMILFGLATIPMLSGVSHLALFLSPKFKTNIRRLVPITVFVMGLLLVVRGMDLGVPYLSPQASLTSDKIVECE